MHAILLAYPFVWAFDIICMRDRDDDGILTSIARRYAWTHDSYIVRESWLLRPLKKERRSMYFCGYNNVYVMIIDMTPNQTTIIIRNKW